MHAPNSHRVRALALIVPAAALLASGCSRDELAPDCFEIDPNTGVCLVPDPGGTAVGIDCTNFPEGAVGATYAFTPPVGGGSGNYSMWMASNLPPGLSIDSNTGLISGTPTQAMEYTGITISVFDTGKGTAFSSECGPLLINPALSSNPVLNEPNHCVPFDASKDEMIALLSGGDGSDITCEAFVDGGSATCPLGDGNGRPPPGITFNDSSCTHSGTIAGNRHGTWVWMIELTQSDYVITVPYCATNDIGTYHDLIMTANGNVTPNTEPGLLEYSAANSLSFGNGSYHWDINDPACPGNDCNNFGFRFDVILTASGSASTASFSQMPPKCSISMGVGMRRRSNRWQRDSTVTGSFSASVVANRNFTCGGGSSSVLSSALKALRESMWTSSMM